MTQARGYSAPAHSRAKISVSLNQHLSCDLAKKEWGMPTLLLRSHTPQLRPLDHSEEACSAACLLFTRVIPHPSKEEKDAFHPVAVVGQVLVQGPAAQDSNTSLGKCCRLCRVAAPSECGSCGSRTISVPCASDQASSPQVIVYSELLNLVLHILIFAHSIHSHL